MNAILHITGGIHFVFRTIGQKVLKKKFSTHSNFNVKMWYIFLELVFMENQAIVPTFQHGFQTGFPVIIYINEKFL